MKILSPAKINLRLKVTGRKQNGFHLLSMLNIFCDLCDEIGIETTEMPGIRLEVNPRSLTPDVRKNFVYLAAERFISHFEIKNGLNISLKKNIPAGSGLGGGSSNAAFVLRWLMQQYSSELIIRQGLSEEDVRSRILQIASETGSDVAFFLGQGASIVSGTGNITEPVKLNFLNELSFFLLLPQEHISTEKVYAALRQKPDTFLPDVKLKEFAHSTFSDIKKQYSALIELIDNDLQEVSENQSELVRNISLQLKGADKFICSMSGSGSAFFCLNRNSPQVTDAEFQSLRELLKDLPVQIRKTRFFSLDRN